MLHSADSCLPRDRAGVNSVPPTSRRATAPGHSRRPFVAPRRVPYGSGVQAGARRRCGALAASSPASRRSGFVFLLAMLVAFAHMSAHAGDARERIAALVDAGRFAAADAAIARALSDAGLPAAQRDALAFERERMRRIRIDFPHDRDAIRKQVRQQVPDLRDVEFERWDAAGLFEHLVIDGQRVYFDRAASNLFRISAEALARRDPKLPPLREGPLERLHPHHREVRAQALASGSSSVAPRRVRVDFSLTVEADAVPSGETVRAWLPYPRAIAGQQEGLRLVASEPALHRIAPESALQRTVYLEREARAGQPTRFSIAYELTVRAQYHAIEPANVVAVRETPALAPFLRECAPHVVFTDELRRFSRDAVGDEKNPYRIAQRLFAAVDRIPWAGAREYSTLRNISDYALRAGHADCGQQTLLLIALLRLNGIPARWQSGWVFSDGDYDTMHDWGALYLEPYGWVPMDVTFGRLAGDAALEWFYLGGLDAYRIAFNDDYGRELVPPKKHFRSETVDLQRGEVEWRGGNLYFDQWGYEFRWRVLPAAASAGDRTEKIAP